MNVTTAQTTLDAVVFGEPLQERVARASDVQSEAVELFEAVNDHREGEWQPAVIDRAIHLATKAIQHADDDRFENYVKAAEETLAAAKWQFQASAEARDLA